MVKQLGILNLLFFSSTAIATKVNFKMGASDFSQNPPVVHRCKYDDVFKMRPAKNPVEEAVPTIVLNSKTAREPESHKFCENIFTNLTELDQQKVRDDIAAILKDIPCEPESEWLIRFDSTLRDDAEGDYPGIKHKQIVNRMELSGCLSEMPAFCSLPPKTTSWDSGSLIVDYEKMMNTFRDCKEAIIKKVEDEGLLAKWQAANNPNSAKGKTDKKHLPALVNK